METNTMILIAGVMTVVIGVLCYLVTRGGADEYALVDPEDDEPAGDIGTKSMLMGSESEVKILHVDLEAQQKFIKAIVEVLDREDEQLLNVMLALEAVLLGRAGSLKNHSAEEDQHKIEEIIILGLKQVAPKYGLDFEPFLKQ